MIERIVPARLGTSFRWLMGSSWTSNLGDGIALAAGPLLVASQTREAFLVAMASVLQRLPWLLFGLLAGVLADRLDRRRIVITVDLMRCAVIAVLALSIATDWVSIWVVLGAMFLIGTAEVFADTTTSTLLPMLVAPRDLGTGNARLMTGAITLNQLAGPPFGAFLFGLGMVVPFVTQAVCIALAALLISRIRLPEHGSRRPVRPGRRRQWSRRTDQPVAPTTIHDAAESELPGIAAEQEATRGGIRSEIADGLRFLWRHPAVRTLTLTIVTFNVTFGAAWSVLVLYAIDILGAGEVGFGLLTTASAIGGLVGTGLYGWITERVSLSNIMRAGLLIETFTHLAFVLTRQLWLALVIMFVFGAHAFIWGTTSMTVRQRAVPQELQGRVSSTYLIGVMGGMVVGGTLGGWIAEVWGVLAPFWFAFVGSAVLVVLIWRQLPHIAHADEQSLSADPE